MDTIQSIEVLLLLHPNAHGVYRLRYSCPSPAHAAFIAFNFEPHCYNIYVTKAGDEKPFIEGFKAFGEWYNASTWKPDLLTFKTTKNDK